MLAEPGVYELRVNEVGLSHDIGSAETSYTINAELNNSLERIEEVRSSIFLVNDALIRKLQKYPKQVYELTPRQLEELVAELLDKQGCEVILTPQTHDGGKDILVSIDTPVGKILSLVDTKLYAPHRTVGVGMVRQLYGTLYDHDATHAMMVTTSYFSKDAADFQTRHKYEINLKDFEDIKSWINSYGG
jgi:restriction system protein